jgi:hypothetical protein
MVLMGFGVASWFSDKFLDNYYKEVVRFFRVRVLQAT